LPSHSAFLLILASIASSFAITLAPLDVGNASTSNQGSESAGASGLTIGGRVYNDTNGNLQPDQNETGISGWNVGLLKNDGSITSATTDQNTGAYEFSGLPPGKYFLYLEDIPVPHIGTRPANATYSITLEGNGTSGADFGVFKNSYQLVNDVSFNADIFGFTVEGIALDSSGNILYTDVLNKVVRKFSSNGTALSSFGNGTLTSPGGLAIDSNGNVFVADKSGAIKTFDANGNLLAQQNSTGHGTDEFDSPRGIAFDSNGNLYVADGGNHRILVFDANGEHKTTIGSVISQESTANLPEFHKEYSELPWSYLHLPFEAKVDSQGNVWVADTVNNRVQKFDSNGKFLLSIGRSAGDRPGPQEGSFNRPRALAIGPEDSVYIADTYYNRIQVFDSSGKFLRAFGSLGSEPGQLSSPSGIAVDKSSGAVYVVDSGNARIQVFDGSGEPLAAFPTRSLAMEPYFSYIDSAGYLLVSDNAEHKVHKFNLNTGEHIGEFGGLGSDPGKFRGPRGIGSDSQGNIWVADNYNNRIQKFDANGSSLLTIGKLGSQEGQFRQPRGLVVDSADNVLVADTQNNRIQKFDSKGEFVVSYTTPSLIQPYQIALDNGGNIYVAEAGSRTIEKLDSAGKSLMTFGEDGDEPGQFKEPRGVYVDSAGNIYTSDQSNRIQKFASDGTFISEFGNWGSDAGEFFNPRGVIVDGSDNLWVSDTQNERIQVFDKDGKFVKEISYSP
jgi:streptogramin lyase